MITRTLAAAAIVLAVGGTPTGCDATRMSPTDPNRYTTVDPNHYNYADCGTNDQPVNVYPDTPAAREDARRACMKMEQKLQKVGLGR